MSYASVLKSFSAKLAQPTSIAVMASVGIHVAVGATLPYWSAFSSEKPQPVRNVRLLTLTPNELNRLPNSSSPSPLALPPNIGQLPSNLGQQLSPLPPLPPSVSGLPGLSTPFPPPPSGDLSLGALSSFGSLSLPSQSRRRSTIANLPIFDSPLRPNLPARQPKISTDSFSPSLPPPPASPYPPAPEPGAKPAPSPSSPSQIAQTPKPENSRSPATDLDDMLAKLPTPPIASDPTPGNPDFSNQPLGNTQTPDPSASSDQTPNTTQTPEASGSSNPNSSGADALEGIEGQQYEWQNLTPTQPNQDLALADRENLTDSSNDRNYQEYQQNVFDWQARNQIIEKPQELEIAGNYPQKERSAGEPQDGKVSIAVQVDENGKIISNSLEVAGSSFSDGSFDEQAKNEVRNHQFPATGKVQSYVVRVAFQGNSTAPAESTTEPPTSNETENSTELEDSKQPETTPETENSPEPENQTKPETAPETENSPKPENSPKLPTLPEIENSPKPSPTRLENTPQPEASPKPESSSDSQTSPRRQDVVEPQNQPESQSIPETETPPESQNSPESQTPAESLDLPKQEISPESPSSLEPQTPAELLDFPKLETSPVPQNSPSPNSAQPQN